jgi:hypothetical protein
MMPRTLLLGIGITSSAIMTTWSKTQDLCRRIWIQQKALVLMPCPGDTIALPPKL